MKYIGALLVHIEKRDVEFVKGYSEASGTFKYASLNWPKHLDGDTQSDGGLWVVIEYEDDENGR